MHEAPCGRVHGIPRYPLRPEFGTRALNIRCGSTFAANPPPPAYAGFLSANQRAAPLRTAPRSVGRLRSQLLLDIRERAEDEDLSAIQRPAAPVDAREGHIVLSLEHR